MEMLTYEEDAINALISQVIKLKNSIKCPICLDIMSNPVQISCDHIFCEDCLTTFINNTPNKLLTCPLCKKQIKRQRNEPYENMGVVSKCVRTVIEKLQNQFECDKSINKEKSLKKHKAIIGKGIFGHNSSNTSNKVKRDAFDILMESSSSNYELRKSENVKTYSRKKIKKDTNDELYQKLINFEDNSYRLKIIEWLCDNQNTFDRLTQTQSIIDDDSDSSESSFDMPSISQEVELRTYKNKRKRSESARCTRSLDVQTKTSNFKLRSHSFSSESQKLTEEINIEEIESDKDGLNQEQVNILHILEEKCLNTIDTQLLLQEKPNRKAQIPNKKRKRRKSSNQKKVLKGNITGWARIEEINKTLSKTNREPKQLRVSSSFPKVGKKQVSENIPQIKLHNMSNNPVVVLDRLSSEVELHKLNIEIKKFTECNLNDNETKNSTSNNPVVILKRLNDEIKLHESNRELQERKSYNLNDLESYISNNINKNTSTQKDDIHHTKENVNLITARTSDSVIDYKIDDNELVDEASNPSIIEKSCEPTKNNEEKNDWNFICKTSQGSSKKKSKTLSGSIFSLKNANGEMDDIFELATQKINHDSSVDSVEKNLIALFSSQEHDKQPDQLKTNNNNSEINNVDDAFSLLEQLGVTVSNLEKSMDSNININLMKSNIEKLKLILSKDTVNEYKATRCLSTTTQTVDFDIKSVAVQTDECDSSGFKISSTADFKTLMHHTVGVQTDAFVTETPVCIDSDFSVSSRTSEILVNNVDILNNLKGNYQFTESLDNINFDTQAALNPNKKEVAKNNELNNLKVRKSSVKKRLEFRNNIQIVSVHDTDSESDGTPVEIVTTVASVESTPKKPESLNSNILFSLSNGNDKTIDENEPVKRFKRIRSLEESDSEVGSSKKFKILKNPYIADNLSVEFDSQDSLNENKIIVETNGKPVRMETQQSMNYDEYLDRIMTKYLNQEKHVTPSVANQLRATEQTMSQDIIRKCEVLIKEATDSPPPCLSKTSNDNYITNDILKEFNLPFDEKISNEKATQLVNKLKSLQSRRRNNFSESMFGNSLINTKQSTNELPLSNMESLAREFAEELAPTTVKPNRTNKHAEDIQILQDILLEDEENCHKMAELQYNLEEEWQNMEKTAENRPKSEEVFSDSDVEIIDTTPQKENSVNQRSFMSQSLNKRLSCNARNSLLLLPPEESPDIIFATDALSYLNTTFAPPTEFRDVSANGLNNNLIDIATTDTFDITIVPSNIAKAKDKEDSYIDLDVTLTQKINDIIVNKHLVKGKPQAGENRENILQRLSNSFNNRSNGSKSSKDSPPIAVKSARTKNSNITYDNSHDSRLINISPIKRDSRDLNPIERALKSNFSPLEIITTKPRRKTSTLFSSTPKKQQTILSYINNETISSEQSRRDSQTAQITPSRRNKPHIASTRMSKDEQLSVRALESTTLVTYSSVFDLSVTHMIVAVNENNCIKDHTMKYVAAVAAGIWVVRFEWVQECLSKNEIVPEEPYEALDVSGIAGPRISRLTQSKSSFLKGFRIYIATPCLALDKKDIENVIRMLGGEVVPTIELLKENRGIRLIITEAETSQDLNMCETWLEQLNVVAVDIEWLSRSVGNYRVLSLKPFTLCSDDTLGDLGYPDELLADVPASPSQSIYC